MIRKKDRKDENTKNTMRKEKIACHFYDISHLLIDLCLEGKERKNERRIRARKMTERKIHTKTQRKRKIALSL